MLHVEKLHPRGQAQLHNYINICSLALLYEGEEHKQAWKVKRLEVYTFVFNSMRRDQLFSKPFIFKTLDLHGVHVS